MAPKDQGPSKKAVREKKAAILEDATFGLKNKNKSKKVQQFISRVEKTVKHSHGGADAEKAKELKKEAKIAKQLQEMELNILFNEGISNQFGKKKSSAASKASALGLTETNNQLIELLDGISSDSDSESDNEGYNRKKSNEPIYMEIDEPVATQVFREKTIEDIIEEQRAKLAAEGKKGTPVTAESFAVWRAAKLLQRQEEAEARLKAEQSKKKGGKGLSVLSGKELFKYNAALFVDDDAAIDAKEENAMNNETKLRQEEEEKRQKEETERIQAEQERLAEMQLIELRIRKKKEEDRCIAAKASNRITFILGNIIINQVVFEDDEVEDLTPFPDEQFIEIEVNEPIDIIPLDVDYNEDNYGNNSEENGNSEDDSNVDSEYDDDEDEIDDNNLEEEENGNIEENLNS